jgi:hypothetical protein
MKPTNRRNKEGSECAIEQEGPRTARAEREGSFPSASARARVAAGRVLPADMSAPFRTDEGARSTS